MALKIGGLTGCAPPPCPVVYQAVAQLHNLIHTGVLNALRLMRSELPEPRAAAVRAAASGTLLASRYDATRALTELASFFSNSREIIDFLILVNKLHSKHLHTAPEGYKLLQLYRHEHDLKLLPAIEATMRSWYASNPEATRADILELPQFLGDVYFSLASKTATKSELSLLTSLTGTTLKLVRALDGGVLASSAPVKVRAPSTDAQTQLCYLLELVRAEVGLRAGPLAVPERGVSPHIRHLWIMMNTHREQRKRQPQPPSLLQPQQRRQIEFAFDGRLLPGCCCLSCVNFSESSELALPTFVCGGCRRARYCSPLCQRNAWRVKEGGDGHRLVCTQWMVAGGFDGQ